MDTIESNIPESENIRESEISLKSSGEAGSDLDEKLTLANEELKVINEELENCKGQLEELVEIRTQELKRSEEKFSNVFHHNPCFIVVSTLSNGSIIEVNEAFTRKFGYATEELKGKSLVQSDIIEKSLYKKIQGRINRDGNYKNVEINLSTRDKEKLVCLGSGEKVMIGSNPFIIETFRDITELKTVEERLSLSEIRFSNFIEQSTEGVSYFRPVNPIDIKLSPAVQARKILNNCVLIECNNAFGRMYGYETGNYLVNKNMIDISGDVLEDDWLMLLTEFVKSDYRLMNYQTMEIDENGTMLYFVHNLIGIIKDQKLLGIWNSRRNISDLKKVEESLKRKSLLEQLITGISTRFLNLGPELVNENIQNALHEICNFINADAGFLIEINYSEGYYRLTHMWKNENIKFNQKYFEKAPLLDFEEWLNMAPKSDYYIVSSPDLLPDKSFIKSSFEKSGTTTMVLVPVNYQGILVEIAGFSTSMPGRLWSVDDIALMKLIAEIFINSIFRRNSERILIESERNYREIFNATNEAIFIHDARNGNIIDANHAAFELFGISHEEIGNNDKGKSVAPDIVFNKEKFADFIQLALHNKVSVYEKEAFRKNGESFWAEVSLKSSEIGGDLRVITVVRDVSERKKNEEALRQSEERFRSIVQYLTDIILILDKNLNIIYESPSTWQVLGYSPGYLIGSSGLKWVHPDDLKVILGDLKEVFSRHNDYRPTEFRAKHSDGRWVSFEAIANNMLDHPAIRGLIITCRDITERKRVEKALKISESKFRNIFNNSSDAIIMIGHNYSILEVNEVFLKITGYTLEETKKLKLTDIITDNYLPDIVNKHLRLFRNENLPAIECEIKCKSKHSIPVEINSKLIEFEGEIALVSIIRDITERRQLETRILDTIISTEEKEREKFARNLHDELGPLLSSIRMYINSLSSGVEKEKHDFIISQLQKILTDAIQSTKELSNDLSPHVLVNYGLLAALEWFNDQIKPYIAVSLETNLKDERYPTSLELTIYRIVKELINNTIKHAQADTISIKLHHVMRSLRLVYSDNGVGFGDKWQDNFESRGMGMSNIMSRCRSVNAVSKFYNHAPHGMSFEMEVPVL